MLDVVLDFESYFDREYSLGKMTMQEYVADPRFQTMGCAAIIEHQPAQWVEADDLHDFLDEIPWDDTNLIGHNLIFDAGVLAYHYGYVPKLHSCTLSYSRAIMGALLPRCNLETVAAHFGMKKDSLALFNMLGVRLEDVDRESASWKRYTEYAVSDAIQARTIYNILMPHMPGTERVVVDVLIRMFTQGMLELDREAVSNALLEARTQAQTILSRAGLSDKSELRSREKFAQMLRDMGVEPPTKTSAATGLKTYAFAKDDLPFAELLNHADERVRVLVEAKLNASSTIHESRAEKLLAIANLSPSHRMQVPIAYSAAHTHRFGGLDGLNLQNLPRTGELRRAIRAPKGFKLVVRDSSQIEARLTAYLAGQWDLVEQFAAGEDVYASFAGTVYQRAIDKKTDPGERFVGKTGILGLGYGSGAATFLHMVLSSKDPMTIDYDFAQKVVSTYRARYRMIANLWYRAAEVLEYMRTGAKVRFGPCLTDLAKLKLPSGLHLQYPQLEKVPEMERLHPDWGVEWRYYKPRYRSFSPIYGAKLVENTIQALARIQITDTMIRMRLTNPDWHCALQVHDELVYLAPDDEAEECDRCLSTYMNAQPGWVGENDRPVPLANEGGIGEVYGEAKGG